MIVIETVAGLPAVGVGGLVAGFTALIVTLMVKV